MPTSLLTLKQETVRGYRLRSLTQGTVTSNSTTTLFTDTARVEPAGTFDRIDSFVKFTAASGAASVNINVTRRITGYSTNNTLTFSPAVTASVGSGNTYDIYAAFDPDNDVRLAINLAIRDAFPQRVVQSVATTATDGTTRGISIPSAAANTMTRLVKIERPVGSINSDWSWSEMFEGKDYTLVDYAGTYTLQMNFDLTASTVIRFTGVRAPAELTNDTDTTDEPAHLIELAARKFLALQEGDAAQVERWGRELNSAKQAYNKVRPPETLMVPRFGIR